MDHENNKTVQKSIYYNQSQVNNDLGTLNEPNIMILDRKPC